MLPPGMSFNAMSDKALAANKTSKLPKSFWAWDEMLTMNKIGFFPYTPATQMLQGLAVSIEMLHEEGLDNVFARHHRLAEATRRAVKTWGLETVCRDPKYYSPTLTAVILPEGHDADAFRALALEHFNISYGSSFGALAGKYFRIGHLGDINDTMMMGALAATEMALVTRRRSAQERRRAGGDGLSGVGAWQRAPSRRRSKSICTARPRESGDPDLYSWIPACAGMSGSLATPARQIPQSPSASHPAPRAAANAWRPAAARPRPGNNIPARRSRSA